MPETYRLGRPKLFKIEPYSPGWREMTHVNYNPDMGETIYEMIGWLHDTGRINAKMAAKISGQFEKEMEEESTSPLYFFNMHRYLIDKSNNERIKTSRAYMRVLAESEKAAVKEAGRISSDPSSPEDGIEAEWVWEVESISPLLPPGHSSI